MYIYKYVETKRMEVAKAKGVAELSVPANKYLVCVAHGPLVDRSGSEAQKEEKKQELSRCLSSHDVRCYFSTTMQLCSQSEIIELYSLIHGQVSLVNIFR